MREDANLFNVPNPVSDILKRLLICDIIDQHNTLGEEEGGGRRGGGGGGEWGGGGGRGEGGGEWGGEGRGHVYKEPLFA